MNWPKASTAKIRNLREFGSAAGLAAASRRCPLALSITALATTEDSP
ncbi:hypothetical protein NED98_08565 [Sphingomonas sp. MMSM20]|nr:hypothetical protein [Sphingomonas lycopersici]MCW6530295.1 hypothetical protein [Sphingomonas lycopersici]